MIGKLPDELLGAVLDTLPIEFSVLDANDKVAAWNRHESRLFKRPESVIGRDVRDCHPKSSLDKVEKILSEMKEGKRQKARFWIQMGPKKVLIEYYALRNKGGKYIGCLEASQDITEIKSLEGEKRLLD